MRERGFIDSRYHRVECIWEKKRRALSVYREGSRLFLIHITPPLSEYACWAWNVFVGRKKEHYLGSLTRQDSGFWDFGFARCGLLLCT